MERALYYFLYPPPHVAAASERLTHRVCTQGHGRTGPMPAERLHITLHALGSFEGEVPRQAIDLAIAAMHEVDDEPFDLALDRLQSLRGDEGVGSVELTGIGPQLKRLRLFQRGLGDAMRRAGWPASAIRHKFRPHMTLHYAHGPVECQAVAPVAWTAGCFCLVISHRGQGYHEVLEHRRLEQRQPRLFD